MVNYPLPNQPKREVLLLPPWGKAGKGVCGWGAYQGGCGVNQWVLGAKISFFIILSFFYLSNPVISQTVNYREIFGDDWSKAMTYERENRNWMEPVLTRNHISYPLAIAVIFPELVRYSALRDKMEITLLKALYINLGNEYADFSIGRFQMKPSFAESILEMVPSQADLAGLGLKIKSDFTDIKEFRRAIVSDLEEPTAQLNYLIAFVKICEKKYGIKTKNDSQKLKLLATAYNFGIDKSADQIYKMTDKKFFNTKLYKTQNYSYADVSRFWYNEFNSAKARTL